MILNINFVFQVTKIYNAVSCHWSKFFLSLLCQIAIMGCIVNGPGEMADADFGYVGGAPGKIDLYVGKVWNLFVDLTEISFKKFCIL